MKRADNHKFPWRGECSCVCWNCGVKWRETLTLMLPRIPFRVPVVKAKCGACIIRTASPTLLEEWRKVNDKQANTGSDVRD